MIQTTDRSVRNESSGDGESSLANDKPLYATRTNCMNRTILAATIIAVAALSASVVAEQGSGDNAKTAKQVPPDVTESDKQMAQVQENMKKMQGQMEKIRRNARSSCKTTGRLCRATCT